MQVLCRILHVRVGSLARVTSKSWQLEGCQTHSSVYTECSVDKLSALWGLPCVLRGLSNGEYRTPPKEYRSKFGST